MSCTNEKCEWYDKAKPDGRACYYGEPQCWRGWLDIFTLIIKKIFQRKS